MRCMGIPIGWVSGKKKKKKETSFLSWSSKKKCMKFIIKKKLKETAQNVIS